MTHVNFKEFKAVIEIGVYFSEDLSGSDIEQLIQDWYVYYKESKVIVIEEFINHWFADVSRDTNSYWIDKRGMMLLMLNSKV